MTDYSSDPGVQLMLAYQAGDEAAFDRLVETYSEQVYALITRFTGQHGGREDLVQDVFLRVVRARRNYRPTARFTTWLYRVTFNLCVNETQRSASKSVVSLDAGAEREERGAIHDIHDLRVADPSESLEREDVVRAVRSAIASLPESQRMALILAKYQDLAYAEIASVLESSEKAVKSLIHRARENLRAALAPWLEGESV